MVVGSLLCSAFIVASSASAVATLTLPKLLLGVIAPRKMNPLGKSLIGRPLAAASSLDHHLLQCAVSANLYL
jgi:hypothetical protein